MFPSKKEAEMLR